MFGSERNDHESDSFSPLAVSHDRLERAKAAGSGFAWVTGLLIRTTFNENALGSLNTRNLLSLGHAGRGKGRRSD
jgi:hypothetical protein